MVVGLGGVGSWAVEALARTGLGKLILVDMDDICISNVNRQIHATPAAVGRSKALLMAERVAAINPECDVVVVNSFFTERTLESVFSHNPTVVIDAIDRVTNKTLLIATCVQRGIPLVTTGSAGNRADPSSIVVADLAHTVHDPLLSFVRKKLRSKYAFSRAPNKKFKVPCVYAPLQRNTGYRSAPSRCRVEGEEGFTGLSESASSARTCSDGMGTACFVTGTVGFFAASEAVKLILSHSVDASSAA